MDAKELADELALHMENWRFVDADCEGETAVESPHRATFHAQIDGDTWEITVHRTRPEKA